MTRLRRQPAPSEAKPQGPAPEEEIPDWVLSSVLAFLEPFFQGEGPAASGFGPGWGYEGPPRDFVREVERSFQVTLPWNGGRRTASNALWRMMQEDRGLLAKIIDYALRDMMMGYGAQALDGAVKELTLALEQSGANYVIVQPDPQYFRFRLEKRTLPTARAAVAAQARQPGNAATHLDKAWRAAFGRDPNPSLAYSEAIKAVEAAAIPLVLPNDAQATLGKIVGELRANPQKFQHVLTRDAEPVRGSTLSPIQVVTAQADLLWSNQMDRHAPGDPQPPTPITQQQAEHAVFIAVTLVQTFRAAMH